MNGRSVRFRITALATVVAVVVLTGLAVVVTALLERQLLDNLDRSLAQRADQIEAAARADPAVALANGNDEDRFAQVVDPEGSVRFATANLAGRPAVVPVSAGDGRAHSHTDIPIEDDVYRVLVRRFEDGYVIVGENIDDVQDAERSLAWALAITIPLAVTVLAATTWWLVGHALRPVERIRQGVASVGVNELDRRVPAPGTGDEVDRLAATMNAMLARLDDSVARQQRFLGDASHELRSPLTRIRSTLEVDLAQPGADLRSSAQSALEDVTTMQGLVDDLLFLARHDAGEVSERDVLVDLDVIIDDEVRRLRPTVSVTIDMTGVSGAPVMGNRAALSRLIRNLLANAVRHARSHVVVRSFEHDGRITLSIDDDGPGIPLPDRTRVFDRFVRLDDSRTAADGRSGLGLAIVAEVAALHHATVEVSESPSSGARVTVTFPAAP